MFSKINLVVLLFMCALLYSCSIKEGITSVKGSSSDINTLSEEFLLALKTSKPTGHIKTQLAELSQEEVAHTLTSDAQRLAFWMNIYNAFIIDILTSQPDLWEDRREFFKRPQIKIMGMELSFSDIEHGIIRRSQNELGGGYIPRLFVKEWERLLRIDERDYRVHFALNCGAKDCPPVRIYSPEKLNDQLNKATREYLKYNAKYYEGENKVVVTPLFSWFRGDFGGKSGTRTIINRHGITPKEKVKLEFAGYDWTLYLNNFAE